MGELIRKSQMCRFVAKYRRIVIAENVDEVLRDVCVEIEKRYEIKFLEIGSEGDHIHLQIQSVPMYSPFGIFQKVKGITAREVSRRVPTVRMKLWGGEFWTDGYFVSTVGEHASEDVIRLYIQNRGKSGESRLLHKAKYLAEQVSLFGN